MASRAPSRRVFDILGHVVQEKIPMSVVKISHGLSTLFEGSVYDRSGKRRIIAEFEANGDQSCPETSTTLRNILCDKGCNRDAYLVLAGVGSPANVWCELTQCVQFVSIPDSVEELCEQCFSETKRLLHVTFGESSSLKKIGKRAFYQSGLREIHIPDSVEELCEECFSECETLFRVVFGESSSLRTIGERAFYQSGLREIPIPDSVKKTLQVVLLVVQETFTCHIWQVFFIEGDRGAGILVFWSETN